MKDEEKNRNSDPLLLEGDLLKESHGNDKRRFTR
jgi:hypothetical protein